MNQTRQRILTSLAAAPVSGPTLADELAISRAAVWKHIEALRDEGFVIESGDDGYQLTEIPEMSASALELDLDAPFDIEYHEEIDSTNRRARELAEDGETDTVVIASAQTAGRGRLDRRWESPPGGVYLSIVCRPDLPPVEAPLYTLAAAVATTRAARETGIDARIKWPNDVLVVGENQDSDDSENSSAETHKLAGILTEMKGEADRIGWLVVGIGVNVDDPGIEGATGLRAEAETVETHTFVQRLLEEFASLRDDPDAILPAWRDYALTLDRFVRVETPDGEVVGRAVDIESPGTLLVEPDDSNDETIYVHAGDCEHLRPT
jgi:BirA family biotin operon repressor/biotin-[acetyl-CoA-carboxylase] ligase